jgi:hypothetical protein
MHSLQSFDALLTDKEAEIDPAIRLPRATLKTLRCRRRGPAYLKIGRRVLYRRCDLIGWLDAHRIATCDEQSAQGVSDQ